MNPVQEVLGRVRPNHAVTTDWVRALDTTRRLRESPNAALAAVVHEFGQLTGDSPALVGSDESLTYASLSLRVNQYSRWALAQGLAPNDVVCLLMSNRPDYVAIWLGLTQIGCVVALLNTHVKSDALVHSVQIAGACCVIVENSLVSAMLPIIGQLPDSTRWWVYGGNGTDFPRLDLAIWNHSGEPLNRDEKRNPMPRDRALLIYTSGTTGLPKAANVSHARVMEWSGWFAGMMDAQPKDRLYDCLPLYHSVGGVVAIGSMLVAGGSAIIRERYSTTHFWEDVADSGATIIQYIGEFCRYLLQAPPHSRETDHHVRLLCGNGLRGDVWPEFQRRFAIPQILEFYAATEGNVSLINCEGQPGSVGRVPRFLAHRFPVAIIRCDAETGSPLRDPASRCIRCAENEVGEVIGLIGETSGGTRRYFDGYTDRQASEKKILHDVFSAGDRWFRTGDLMYRDTTGYYYFVDRMGDTFRWKGENVSSTEVESVVAACPGVFSTVVYGVAIPGMEGKAGMAALVVDKDFSLSSLYTLVAATLPAYAQPLFVRLCSNIETTGTFKPKKTELSRQGYMQPMPDPVWFNDKTQGAFIPLDAALQESINAGEVRL